MPAGSDRDPPETTAVFRPLGVRVAAVVLLLLLLGVSTLIWFAFPPDVRAQFNLLQRLTLLLIGMVAIVAGHALARSRVEAGPDGLLAVNGYRRHLYAWEDVAGVTLRAGGPWAIIELADGSRAPAMGIQGSDGSRAVAQVQRLREVMRNAKQDSAGRKPGAPRRETT